MDWIKFKDRSPTILGLYICYSEFGSGYVDTMYWNGETFESEETDSSGNGYLLEDVSHWMPLPEPPNQLENKILDHPLSLKEPLKILKYEHASKEINDSWVIDFKGKE